MIRYTAEDVLPRLQLVIEQVRAERESKRQARRSPASHGPWIEVT